MKIRLIKIFKLCFYLCFTLIISIYITCGFIFFNWHSTSRIPNEGLKNKISNYIIRNIGAEICYKAYSFNPIFLSNKSDYKLMFSKKDKFLNDSIVNLALSNNEFLTFSDDLKVWKKASILTKEGLFDIKYKFHGTSLTPYSQGKASFKIKSKHPINGFKNFRLISDESSYKSFFFNDFANQYDLICEDIIALLLFSGYNGTKLYLQSSGFSNNYLKTKYNIENVFKFKSMDEWYNDFPRAHVNNLDGVGYAIEVNHNDMPIDIHRKKHLNSFIKIRNGNIKDIAKSDYKYFGEFLGLLYFFGHPHQVTGDNDTWINVKDRLLPIYRNEGHIDALNCNKGNFDNYLWETYYKTNSLIPYKKLLLNDSIRNFRNLLFNDLVIKKDSLLTKFDSLFESFKNTYYNYDYRYFKLKKEHFQFRENIKHNINLIKEYLKITELAAYIDSDTLRITADSYVNVDVIVNSKLFTVIKPRKYSINDDQITTCLVNHKLYYPNKIHEITFRNSITKDTISNKRLSVIY
tara:strand:+ start:84 stop:1640 length:1557 start_codon:yes stop_codon:yes gene_type:complete